MASGLVHSAQLSTLLCLCYDRMGRAKKFVFKKKSINSTKQAKKYSGLGDKVFLLGQMDVEVSFL